MSGKFRNRKVYFTQVSNNALRDNDLSLKAKGLYALIQSYITIPDFVLYKDTLMKQCKESKTAFNSAWGELKDKGYLMQYKLKNNNTKQFYYEYELFDEPQPQNRPMGIIKATTTKPTYGKATRGEQGVYNKTNLNNTYSVVVVDPLTQEKLTLLEKFNISITDNQKTLLDKLDLDLLEVALDTTIAQGGKSFSYLFKVYLSMEKALEDRSSSATHKKTQLKSNINVKPIISQKKTGFHNFEPTFTKYTEEELEKMILEQQQEKWAK